MSKKGIHPAIIELQKYLHQKGDINLVAFIQRWMASWLEVAYFETTLTKEELSAAKDLESMLQKQDRRAFEKLGISIGTECVETDTSSDDGGTTYKYSVLVMRKQKKLVLADS